MIEGRPAVAYLTVDHFLVLTIDRYEISIVEIQIEIKLEPDFLAASRCRRSCNIEASIPIVTKGRYIRETERAKVPDHVGRFGRRLARII